MENDLIQTMKRTNKSVAVSNKRKQASLDCKICGAPAIYSYVGVVVCFSCKMFFKRNAETKKVNHL